MLLNMRGLLPMLKPSPVKRGDCMSYFTRTVYVAILLCITVSLTGCFGGGASSLISVSGTITSGSTNIPVEGATVALVRKQTSAQTLVKGTQSSRVATTDRNGRFQLVGIERGTYDLKVLREGYNPVTLTKRLDRTNDFTINANTYMCRFIILFLCALRQRAGLSLLFGLDRISTLRVWMILLSVYDHSDYIFPGNQ
jgi:hypothetical protein